MDFLQTAKQLNGSCFSFHVGYTASIKTTGEHGGCSRCQSLSLLSVVKCRFVAALNSELSQVFVSIHVDHFPGFGTVDLATNQLLEITVLDRSTWHVSDLRNKKFY